MALAGPANVSVTPNQGSGLSQTFSFVFSDTNGFNFLKQVNVDIDANGTNANSCLVSYMPSNNDIYLLNDAGNAYLPGVPIGSGGTLQNSQCTVNVGGSSVSGSGNDLTLNVAITFNSSYAGAQSIHMDAVDNAGADSGWMVLGTWTVGTTTGSGCSAGPAPSVTICSPTNGSTVASPVHVVAVPSSTNGVTAMAVYFDNTLVYKQNVQQVDTLVNAAPGAHYVVVQFWNNNGNVPAKASVNITVGSTTSAPTAALSASPTSISSGGSSTLTWSTTNATSVSIDNGVGTVPASGTISVLPAATTTYTLTATGPGGTATATATVTVGSGGGGGPCNPPSSPGAVLCTPALGSTVTSPVQFTGAGTGARGSVNHLELWIDNTKIGNYTGNTMSASVPLANGSHSATLVEVDSSGAYIKSSPDTFTVGTSTGAVSVSINPTAATVATGGVQQFSATVSGSSTTSVTWSVDGIAGGNSTVGTVSSSGLYTAPASTGTHNVTATSVADSTKSASAAVTVIPPGTCGGGANNTLSICSPSNGASVTSPFQVIANANSSAAVTKFLIYIDSVLVYQQANTSSINTSVTASIGTHNLVVQYYNGTWIKAAETITVTSSGGGGGTPGTADVLTSHNNPSRSGVNPNETALTPSNVNPSQFGKIDGYGVDGQVYAQPLIVSNFGIGGGTHNVLYVATEHDSVYAFDADFTRGTPYWSVSLLGPGQTTVSSGDNLGISPEVGITSTPVIDRGNNVIYVVAYVNNGGSLQFWLHALDLTSGAERFGGPARVTATISGTGSDSSNGQITLEGACWQRSGLAEANGTIYIGFGHCNHGWVLAYNATNLSRTGVYNTSPNGAGGTIWMSGGAPAVDASGEVYVMTGTNFGDTPNNGFNNSFLKFSPSLSLLDYFQPSNNATLVQNDADLGSGGPMILPDNSSQFPHEIIGAGKDGRIFLINRDNMGGFDPSANHVIQVIQSGSSQYNNFYDTPAFWNGSVYYHANGDVLRVFSWTNGLLSTSPVMTGSTMFAAHGDSPSISSNGTSDAIVWELQNDGQPSQPTVLHAYDASDVSHELYNSDMNSGDHAGPAVKFTVPTIANGKVYVPAGHEVDIYGLK